jgi:flagellar basal body-associated protein FliL
MVKKLAPVIIALIALGGVYKFVLAKPKEAAAKPKVDGTVYVLGKEFLVNLADGRFAKLTVALVLSHDDTSTAAAGGHGAAKPPEGFGPMSQEAVVRDIITDDLTDAKDTDLIERAGREKVKREIVGDLKAHTDVKVEDVLFTDVTVQ